MTISRAILVAVRLLFALIVSAALAVTTADRSFATPIAASNPDILGRKSSPPKMPPKQAPTARIERVSSGNYLSDLLEEINARRAMVGTQTLTYIGEEANDAVACGTHGSQRGGRAFETIACVTFRR